MADSTPQNLSPEEQTKQIAYRDARTTGTYDDIWQSVGKCVFCDLRDKYIFFEENGIVMTVSLFAYIDGNLMIVPRRHVRSTKDLTDTEWNTIRKFTYLAKKIIRDVHDIKGVNFVLRDGGIVANSTVSDHLHIHAIPFDAPDLITWNYRRLHYTPLENANLYRQAGKKLLKYEQRFDSKYQQPSALHIKCDLVIVNTRREILFQERTPEAKFNPDILSLPGGGVDDFSQGLEAELAREVREETNLDLDPTVFQLVASRPSTLHRVRPEPHLGLNRDLSSLFLWNTYLLTGFDAEAATLTAGDDCRKLLWIPLVDIPGHPDISDPMKQTIAELKL